MKQTNLKRKTWEINAVDNLVLINKIDLRIFAFARPGMAVRKITIYRAKKCRNNSGIVDQ